MHRYPVFSFVMLPFLMLSCTTSSGDPIVLQKKYIHRYGATITPKEWEITGKTGQEEIYLKDGTTIVNSFYGGVLEGVCTQTFPKSAVIEIKKIYKNDALVSLTRYHRSGLPLYEERCQGELKQTIQWYENGAPRSDETHQGDLLVQGNYFSLQQEVESIVTQSQGCKTERDFHGLLLSKQIIANGKVIEKICFDSAGALREKIAYQQGQWHGLRQLFAPNGQPQEQQEWKQGERTGITMLYCNGLKCAEVPYLQGEKEGIEKQLSDAGVLLKEISWHHDLLHGPISIYFNGRTHVEWYFRGKAVSKRQYDLLTRP